MITNDMNADETNTINRRERLGQLSDWHEAHDFDGTDQDMVQRDHAEAKRLNDSQERGTGQR